jgi:hypothetical protein
MERHRDREDIKMERYRDDRYRERKRHREGNTKRWKDKEIERQRRKI